MPTYTEDWVMAQWLYATLNVSPVTTIATGGVYQDVAPPSASGIVVTFELVGSQPDLYAMNSQPLVWSEMDWDVKAIGSDLQVEDLTKVSAIIFGLLNGKSAIVSSGEIKSCRRISPIPSYPTVEEGIVYQHRGGTYRIKARAT